MGKDYLFTSESVTEGHPDKISDKISDSVLDAILENDKHARVACETFTSTGYVVVGGEITTTTYVPIQDIVRDCLKDIGYTSSKFGISYRNCAVLNAIGAQSPDINQAVDKKDSDEIGAGDQGLMFGYATKETDVLMPAPIHYAHRLAERLAKVRKNNTVSFFRPDGKTQVTFKYEDCKPKYVDTIVISTQHDDHVNNSDIENAVRTEVIDKVDGLAEYITKDTKFYINPSGRFVLGGPHGDAGLTGRKIIVDTYGGSCPHGGGAFSGKDPTKVDRSGAYIARYIAKNIVAADLADEVVIQLSYAIGIAHPISVMIDTKGTAKVDEKAIEKAVMEVFDMTPKGIIESLDLLKPRYAKTAAYGHFGRNDHGFTWERTDKIEELKKAIR